MTEAASAVARKGSKGRLAELRRLIEQIGRGRVLLSLLELVLVVVVARYSWDMPLLVDA